MKRGFLTVIMLVFMIILTGCNSSGAYDKDGKKNFEAGDYKSAADYFNKAIAANPNRAQYYIEYGLALTALGEYKEALKQFDKAYINKDMSIVRKNNKRALRGKGIVYYRMQKYDQAIKEFDDALKIDVSPKLDMDILYYMGGSYRAIGDFKNALDVYSKLLKEDSGNAEVYANRAYCYRVMGKYKNSLNDYDRAIKLSPNQFEYYFGKFNLLMDEGENTAAQEALKAAASIKVVTDEDKYNLAKLRFYQKDYDNAITELKDSAQKGFTEADYYIGEIYRMNKDYEKAIYYYENYIKSGNISTPNVYNQAADCLIKTGDYKKAIEYLETGITYKNADTMQYLLKNEIIAYEKLGDFKTAKDKLASYLEDYPNDKAAVREEEFIDTRLMDAVVE